MNNVVFVDTDICACGNEVVLKLSGHIVGEVYGENIDDACNKLLPYLAQDATVYVDTHGYGWHTKNLLERYMHVREYTPHKLF